MKRYIFLFFAFIDLVFGIWSLIERQYLAVIVFLMIGCLNVSFIYCGGKFDLLKMFSIKWFRVIVWTNVIVIVVSIVTILYPLVIPDFAFNLLVLMFVFALFALFAVSANDRKKPPSERKLSHVAISIPRHPVLKIVTILGFMVLMVVVIGVCLWLAYPLLV